MTATDYQAPISESTSAGTGYTEHYIVPAGTTERAMMFVPDSVVHGPTGTPVYVVVYFHGIGGVGGNEKNFRAIKNKLHRDILMDDVNNDGEGRFIVVASNAADRNAGNTAGSVATLKLLDHVEMEFNVQAYLTYGQSMGGLLALLAVPDPAWPSIAGVVGISPVTSLYHFWADLDYRYAVEGAYTPWGTPNIWNDTVTANRDPLNDFVGADYAEARYRLYASPGDTAVPPVNNSTPFINMVKTGGSPEAEVVMVTGGHLSAEHYEQTFDFMRFLERSVGDISGNYGTPPPPPPPPTDAQTHRFLVGGAWERPISHEILLPNGNWVPVANSIVVE